MHLLHEWDFKYCSLGFQFIIPGCKLIPSSICAQFQLGFTLMPFVCHVKLGILLSLGLGWPVSLRGLNNFKTCFLSCLWFCTACTHNRQSGHSSQGRVQPSYKQGQRPDLLCLWSLIKTIYLISLVMGRLGSWEKALRTENWRAWGVPLWGNTALTFSNPLDMFCILFWRLRILLAVEAHLSFMFLL